MGRTPKPLVIWAHSSLWENEVLHKLHNQGHTIKFLEDGPDLIVGPNCWRIPEGMEVYIQMAVDTARKLKYPGKAD